MEIRNISAYTPGLTVTPRTTITKLRRLPTKGDVLVKEGEEVKPDTVIAHSLRQGHLTMLKLASEFGGIDSQRIKEALLKNVGDEVKTGDKIAERKSFFGFFTKMVKSPCNGTIELFSPVTGNLGIRSEATPIELLAYIKGKVTQVIPQEGAEIETQAAFIQGIFGVGGERHGIIQMLAESPDEKIDVNKIPPDAKNKVLVGGASFSSEAIKKANELKASGLVTGSIADDELRNYLGYDIGVVMTGREAVNTAIIVTEGFGNLPMSDKTFNLLQSLNGKEASISGATQIRAGVIRPEIIVPIDPNENQFFNETPTRGQLAIGSTIRLLRDPYFGILGIVEELPEQPTVIETGTTTRVLKARINDSQIVTVPRANVELVED